MRTFLLLATLVGAARSGAPDYSTVQDCPVNKRGQSEARDDCGVCGGKNANMDDCGNCGGNNAAKDVCGVCNGDDSTCVHTKSCFGLEEGTKCVTYQGLKGQCEKLSYHEAVLTCVKVSIDRTWVKHINNHVPNWQKNLNCVPENHAPTVGSAFGGMLGSTTQNGQYDVPFAHTNPRWFAKLNVAAGNPSYEPLGSNTVSGLYGPFGERVLYVDQNGANGGHPICKRLCEQCGTCRSFVVNYQHWPNHCHFKTTDSKADVVVTKKSKDFWVSSKSSTTTYTPCETNKDCTDGKLCYEVIKDLFFSPSDSCNHYAGGCHCALQQRR